MLLTGDAYVCRSELDCHLNGVCNSNGMCECDDPWTGVVCGNLNRGDLIYFNSYVIIILSGKANVDGAYGYKPNVSSWGGNSLLDENVGLYPD